MKPVHIGRLLARASPGYKYTLWTVILSTDICSGVSANHRVPCVLLTHVQVTRIHLSHYMRVSIRHHPKHHHRLCKGHLREQAPCLEPGLFSRVA